MKKLKKVGLFLGLISVWALFHLYHGEVNPTNTKILSQNWELNLNPTEMDTEIFQVTVVEETENNQIKTTLFGLSYEEGRLKGNWSQSVSFENIP